MFEVKQAGPPPPARLAAVTGAGGLELVKKMLNPKVRWNSRSRIRAARLAGTRKQRSEKKFSIDVFPYFYPL